MAAKFRIVDPSTSPRIFNWDMCVFCQEERLEKLVIPERTVNKGNEFAGYAAIASVLDRLNEIRQLSVLSYTVRMSDLNDGSGIYNTLLTNKAKYHKTCRSECSERTFTRAEKRLQTENLSPILPKKTRQCRNAFAQSSCIFCDEPSSRTSPLSMVSTMKTSQFISTNALRCTQLLANLGGSDDLIALGASYHNQCYTNFKNKVRNQTSRKLSETSTSTGSSEIHSYALANLVAYINDLKEANEEYLPVMKMSDLVVFYENTVKDMGIDFTAHPTRLRERILIACPYLQASGSPGKETLLTFRSDVDDYMRDSTKNADCGSDFSAVAKIIRRDIFQETLSDWEEGFENQNACTPLSLKILLKMICQGPGQSLGQLEDENFDQAIHTISQLICFRTKKKGGENALRQRHNRANRKPVPVYLGMKIYGETRSRNLIDTTYKLGLTISYDQLRAMMDEETAIIRTRFSHQNVVCPKNFLHREFTIGAVDNIDHDTSSFTAKSSFHGTAISLTQFPDSRNPGFAQQDTSSPVEHRKTLPLEYVNIKPCFLNGKCFRIPSRENCFASGGDEVFLSKKDNWFDALSGADALPWSVFHSRGADPVNETSIARTAVLPLFSEQSHSLAMMAHCMNIVIQTTRFLNPEQTPVLVADQPLYALCKISQFLGVNSVAESSMVIMMGGLHIEMASLRAVGSLLKDSGWVEALVQAEVTTQGRAESMIKASHVTRTRYVHEVTAAVLHDLQQMAFDDYVHWTNDIIHESFEEWYERKSRTVPQFKYWNLVLQLEILILQLVRSFRSADFELYKATLGRLAPWFFTLDQVNYARWLPVHIRDMVNLETTHPDVARQFSAGNFVVKKSVRPFSAIALDQNHEQANAVLKGNGGMIGITTKPESLEKWLLAAPLLANHVSKFEEANFQSQKKVRRHHNDNESFISRFHEDVASLKKVFLALGNPFSEEHSNLYNIETKDVAPMKAIDILHKIETVGTVQYEQFVKERLESSGKLLTDTIPQNKFSIWSVDRKARDGKGNAKLKALKNDCSLFSRLFIASQNRESDLENFFAHENQPYPPSLTFDGRMYTGTKSDIIKCLTGLTPEAVLLPIENEVANFDIKIFDGAALVHMLPPGPSKTFQDYVDAVFIPYITRECTNAVRRIDLIWDTYLTESLKNGTREKRGHGDRVLVTSSTKIPRKTWSSFLCNSDNKTQLFKLLAESIRNLAVPGVDFYSTLGANVISSSTEANFEGLSPCNHEEADTRIILHAWDAARKGFKKCLIRTSDSDVLTLAVAYCGRIPGLENLSVCIGTGKNRSIVDVKPISVHLGPERCEALPVFHAITGCDVVSAFFGKGKKSAFSAWEVCPEATEGFSAIGKGHIDAGLPLIEKFLISLYDRTSDVQEINECRRVLFTRKSRDLPKIPPSKNALQQHCHRAGFQGGQVWGQCLRPLQDLPDPEECGWKRTSGETSVCWEPVWTTIPPIQESLLALVKCGCKSCGSRCKCAAANLPCTELCQCGGKCCEI